MKFKRILVGCMVFVFLSLSVCNIFSVSAEENEPIENYGLDVDTQDYAEILLFDENVGASNFSSFYDPRDLDYPTPVEAQSGGTCWMYATTAAVEQHIAANYGSKIDLSEAHGLFALSNRINTYNYSSGYYTNEPKTAGTLSKALQYFTSWNAPLYYRDSCDWKSCVLDSYFPRTKLIGNSGIDNDFLNASPSFNVSGTRYIIKSEDNIKTAILNYGAVISGMSCHSDGVTEKNGDNAYYLSNSSTSINHLINIVGWDDNYSKNNFKESRRPPVDGAWLVRNSNIYGEYFWMSYYEGSIYCPVNHMGVVTDIKKSSANEHMISYDYLALNKSEYITDTAYICNVFDFSDYSEIYDEIKSVMFYLSACGYDPLDPDVPYKNDVLGICYYEIKVLPVDNAGNIATDYNNYTCLASGQFSGEGYLTVDLNSSYPLGVSQSSAVVIKLVPLNNQTAIRIPYSDRHPDVIGNTSFFGTSQNNSISWSSQFPYGAYLSNPGCFIIRPILGKTEISPDNISVYPTSIIPDEYDSDVYISSMEKLCYIHTRNGQILREDIDYCKYTGEIALFSDYTNSLNGVPTEIVFEFCNDTSKSVVINPKSVITEINLYGDPIVGDTLTAECIGNPVRDSYDVNYQWQYSINGTNWQDISGANSSQYEIDENLFGRYLRVVVTPQNYGNVSQGNTSSSTSVKTVVLGDVDLDGEVTTYDVTLLQQYLAELIVLTDRQLLAADANRDGRITVSDVSQIERIVNGY